MSKKQENKMSFVYIITDDIDLGRDEPFLLCKLGRSTKPRQRIAALSRDSHCPLRFVVLFETDQAELLEAHLHKLLRRTHFTHEWFRLSLKDIVNIKRVAKDWGAQIHEGDTFNLRQFKTTECGLRDGWTRATIIIRKKYMENLKTVAYWQRTTLKQLFDEGMGAYLKDKKKTGFGQRDLREKDE